VHRARLAGVLPGARAPRRDSRVHEIAHWDDRVGIGAEVPGLGEAGRVIEHARAEHQVAAERLEHVLPRPRGRGVAHAHRATVLKRADDVWHYAVGRPVSAADDVARAGGRKRAAQRREERVSIRRAQQLRACLARAVRIVTAENVVLAVAPVPLVVAVALVRRDDDGRRNRVARADSVEHVSRARHIDGERLGGVIVRVADDGLCGQVKDDVGPGLEKRCGDVLGIADIADDVSGHEVLDAGHDELVAVGVGLEGITRHVRAGECEPLGEPRALEAGVPGDEDAFARVRLADHRQTFHGAAPSAHSRSSKSRSRTLSMGCQNPSCRKTRIWSSAVSCCRAPNSRSQSSSAVR